MFIPLKNTMSLLLAAMLFGATVAPPAVRHSHPVAEGAAGRYHNHDDRHSHAHGQRHSDEAQPTTLAEVSCSHWWHLHFQVFGLKLTLPEPDPGQNDRQSEVDSEVLALVPGQKFFSGSSSRSDSLEHRVLTVASSVVGSAAAMHAVVSAPPPVSYAPLCDTARRERSGVLLA
jgi:hypothetical protein